MKIYMMEQKSKDWFEIRRWKLTASNWQAIWNVWKWLDTYVVEVMSDYYSSWVEDNFISRDMQKGIDLEPLAREEYELVTGNKVTEVGFIEYDEYVWCSPDGLVGEDGWVEIKCLKDTNYFKIILNGESEIDTKHIWQMQMNMLITGRQWWDYVVYCPNYERNIITFRIYPDSKQQAKLLEWFEIWKQKIEAIKKIIGTPNKVEKIIVTDDDKKNELF